MTVSRLLATQSLMSVRRNSASFPSGNRSRPSVRFDACRRLSVASVSVPSPAGKEALTVAGQTRGNRDLGVIAADDHGLAVIRAHDCEDAATSYQRNGQTGSRSLCSESALQAAGAADRHVPITGALSRNLTDSHTQRPSGVQDLGQVDGLLYSKAVVDRRRVPVAIPSVFHDLAKGTYGLLSSEPPLGIALVA
jgi:hypothetical protein